MNRYTTFIVLLFLITFKFHHVNGQQGIEIPAMSVCDDLVLDFVEKYDMRGATLVLGWNEKVIYSRTFGYINESSTSLVQPYNMFRIASVSKPLTAIGIYKLIEEGNLKLSDKVFGNDAIFKDHEAYLNANISDQRIYEITVQHLLEHTAGWDRDLPCFPSPIPPYSWNYNGCDPIVVPLYITNSVGADNPVEPGDYIQFLLNLGLEHDPGSKYAYSNTGYTMLGRIIEIISGKDYETFMKEDIFDPAGAHDIYITSNNKENKHPREVEYEDNGYNNLHIDGSGEIASSSYEGYAIEQMDAHGGWMTSGIDLMKVLFSVDKKSNKADILTTSSINDMTVGSAANPGYGKGWSVNQWKNYWHTGEILGTSSIAAVTDIGFNFVLIFNSRNTDPTGQFWTELDALPWNCYSETNANFPSHDLSIHPKSNATNIVVDPITESSVNISWQKGDGEFTLITISQTEERNAYPLDGIDYETDPTFGLGGEVTEGEYVVYSGEASQVDISGLSEDVDYYLRAYSFNKNSASGANALYLIHNSPHMEFKTATTSTSIDKLENDVEIIPNPNMGQFYLEFPEKYHFETYKIYTMEGRKITEGVINRGKMIDLLNIGSGSYFAKLEGRDYVHVEKFKVYK